MKVNKITEAKFIFTAIFQKTRFTNEEKLKGNLKSWI